jgi:hypothetical protein
MKRHPAAPPFGPKERITAFAEATEAYAESLGDPDLANVYWGKAIGLRQALGILTAEDGMPEGRERRRRPPAALRPRTTAISQRR